MNAGGMPFSTVDVVGFGPVTWDTFLTVPRLPSANERIRAIRSHGSAGGVVPLAMMGLRRWGLRCRLMAMIGDDEFSGRVVRDLRQEGIETDALVVKPGVETRSATVLLDNRNGSRCLIMGPQGEHEGASESFDPSWLTGARVVHLDTAAETDLRAAIDAARGIGARVVYSLGERTDEEAIHILGLADYVLTDHERASLLTGQEDPSQAAYALSLRTAAPVVLTEGAGGCHYANGRETHRHPAMKVPMVDRTGAGALFQAGFIYGLLAAWEMPRILHFATWVSAEASKEAGGRKGIPTESQVRHFAFENP